MTRLTCTRCKGSGEGCGMAYGYRCTRCKGSGLEPEPEEETIPFPRLSCEEESLHNT